MFTGAAALIGANDADRLQQAKMIQNSKILFHKLLKSLTTTFEKQIIPEMNKMDEDGTYIYQEFRNQWPLVASQGAVPDSYGEEGFSGEGAFG